jgi:eukaryotic-like serine/threonine-protein kinase
VAATEETPQEQRVIGRYVLHGEIASGGMATVHFGRLLGEVGFSRTVAIKRLHAQFAKEPDFVSMFIDEARLAARVQHPNVVPTLDVVAMQGELFLVMEYVQGESLSRLLRAVRAQGQRLPPNITSNIIAGLLDGLHAAHEAKSERGEPLGIVHRDVSPQNVLVGVDGTARVLDFGVAKAAVRLQTTREGQLKGKLAYMAPEQLRGEPVDRRTDIYSASVVLWEALVGKRLFEAPNDAALFGKVLAGDYDPPSRHVPSLPAELDTVVMRGLELAPADRFETAGDMALALEQAVSPASSREVGRWVQKTAGENLQRRAERIAEIESVSQIRPGIGRAAVSPSVPPSGAAGEARVAAPTAPDRQARLRPQHWVLLAAVAALALALVVAVATLIAHSRSQPAPISSALSAAPSAAPLSVASASQPVQAPAPSAVGSAAPAASASAPVATSAPSPPAPAHASPRYHASTHSARAHSKVRNDCTPPYTIDAHGIRIPKPQCL